MNIGKKIAHKAEAAKGSLKELFDRASHNTKLAGYKIKDTFKH
ncbi:hypothetical protein MA5S0422_2433 [Mycobacteroides abscessus 5S-0422]|uniref:Uncharacterized protein n=1 Tax=Mycobacteroides abscessus subsp. bolletii 1513 TaxID=1299321 RepID=X8DPP6_9MYCO|nr:hypothetical protein [Mycobacteroides abscessus]EUA70041.1 hypothetical protein I540_2618 [Mycobacteroides abscessus subsp. bolletii 1513]EIU12540.1 hypothetical protein MA5S0304_1499 [Mycobacteroides abscessus 5S-0304]EIU14387.1 hypothetical protein MA5S0421_1751 [Mycobacteroides abscessus 5S-0421]EIU15004.1 hypothetical protein MA5S0422_2433 [Mycobacteroides abscessus 5S-0422]EIU27123.1 hypothetical protein MA5S0708_1975 [Mycobacteroides abscessus 5S-0708]